MITLRDLLARVEAKKAELGIIDTPAVIEAMRNKGGKRTEQKRELLRRAMTRARAAGCKPVPAYF